MADRSFNFAALTEDGSTAAKDWGGGPGTFQVTGTYGSGTYTLEWSGDGGTTWGSLGTATEVTDGQPGNFDIGYGKLRVTVASSSSPNAVGLVRPRPA